MYLNYVLIKYGFIQHPSVMHIQPWERWRTPSTKHIISLASPSIKIAISSVGLFYLSVCHVVIETWISPALGKSHFAEEIILQLCWEEIKEDLKSCIPRLHISLSCLIACNYSLLTYCPPRPGNFEVRLCHAFLTPRHLEASFIPLALCLMIFEIGNLNSY